MSYPAFDAAVRGSPLEFAIMFGVEKLESDGDKSLRIHLAVSTEYRRVTDRRTDRHLATA